MNLAQLKALSAYISSFNKLYHIKRIQDSVLKLEFASIINSTQYQPKISQQPQLPHQEIQSQKPIPHKQTIYMDLTRGDSSAYISPTPLIATKKYSAPFDIVLSRLNGAEIFACEVLSQDRILRLSLGVRSAYKRDEAHLQLEFCGKHTNVIILDAKLLVLEALRHISPLKSIRPVKIHAPLPPMPSNPNTPTSSPMPNVDLADFNATKSILIANYDIKSKKSLQATKSILLNKLEKSKKALQAKLVNLPNANELESKARHLNADATLALAHITSLKPYAKEVDLIELDTQKKRTIILPQAKTPQEAINQMFRESKKLAKRAKNIHLEVNNLESKIAFLSQEIDFVKISQNLDTLKILKPKKAQTKDSQIGRVLFIEGFKLSIGRNKTENKALLESARADDMWLHIRNVPSSHLFIHCGKQAVPEEVLQKAGEILVGMCVKGSGDFYVDYTKRRFVKLSEGANVIYAKQKSIFIKKS